MESFSLEINIFFYASVIFTIKSFNPIYKTNTTRIVEKLNILVFWIIRIKISTRSIKANVKITPIMDLTHR
jgi:hypothetical protein